MSEYVVTTMGATTAPEPTQAGGVLDPVVVSVDGRLFAIAVIGGVAAAVWWAYHRTRKARS